MKCALMAVVVLLSGCASAPDYPVGGYSDEDKAYCQYEAEKATASAPSGTVVYGGYGMSSTFANDISVGIRRGELVGSCLRARRGGYR